MATFKKDPDANLDYTFDWSQYLTPLGDTIFTATWLPDAPLVVTFPTHTNTTATAFVAGGVAGTKLNLTCRIVTNGGRTDDRTIVLLITPR